MNLLETLGQMPNRDSVSKVLNDFGLVGSAAEIGVLWGGFTRIVLKDWKGKAYWCVDAWERQPPEIYRERTNDMDYEKCYQEVQKLANDDKRIIVCKGFSPKIASVVPDETLDWVFIDANHEYQAVTSDMNAWFPKLKPGGLFSGHDYGYGTDWPHFCEVENAVKDWMREHNMNFVTDKGEGQGKSWWSIK